MNNFEVFPNAPITEAVLDIIAELPKGLDLNVFDEFQDTIKDTFKERRPKHSFEAKFQITPGQEEMEPITVNRHSKMTHNRRPKMTHQWVTGLITVVPHGGPPWQQFNG
jgi:hypothetical protein